MTDAPTARASGSEHVDAARLCAEALVHIDAHRFEAARTLLGRARVSAPTEPQVYFHLALLEADEGRWSEALAALDSCVALDPCNAKAHNNRGSALEILGRPAEAEAAYRQAMTLCPDLAQPYLNVGKLLENKGKVSDAVTLYDQAIERGVSPEVVAQARAAALGMDTPRSPDAWVKATFDNFAPMFDAHLGALQYEIPAKIASHISTRTNESSEILDLGCGTGQVGRSLSGRRITGVDLSSKMLAHADASGAYARLEVAEIHAFLQSALARSYDAVCAADVFIYIGSLEKMFDEVARILRHEGWFAFSIEECAGGDYHLLPTGRYAQSSAYIERISQGRFDVVLAQPTDVRLESGAPIRGRLYLLQRRDSAAARTDDPQ